MDHTNKFFLLVVCSFLWYQLVMLILSLACVVITTALLPEAAQKRDFHLALLLKTEAVMIDFF
jgi:hypothetical protein